MFTIKMRLHSPLLLKQLFQNFLYSEYNAIQFTLKRYKAIQCHNIQQSHTIRLGLTYSCLLDVKRIIQLAWCKSTRQRLSLSSQMYVKQAPSQIGALTC